MSWVTVGVMAAGAVMGAKKNARAREIEDADRKLAAETERYSWVTGNKAQPIRSAGSMFADVGQGAASGAMFGQQFGKGGAKVEADPGLGGLDSAGIGSAQATGGISDGGGSWQKMLEDEERKKGMMGGGGLFNT
jgi:hypothetical protein